MERSIPHPHQKKDGDREAVREREEERESEEWFYLAHNTLYIKFWLSSRQFIMRGNGEVSLKYRILSRSRS